MKQLPLEDTFADVLTKAQYGQRIRDADLAERTGLPEQKIRAARTGTADLETLAAVAPHLGLNARALVAMAQNTWQPAPAPQIEGFAMFTTEFDDMTVNAFLVWDPQTHQAAAFDTGATCEPMLKFAHTRGLGIELVLLTHTHEDHIADLEKLVTATEADVFASEREPFPGGQVFPEHFVFVLGNLTIRTLSTWGHSEGGTTYVIDGLSHPIAIVGDSLFASSMGGGKISYAEALKNNREKIMRLPEQTILASGHGPLTTVGEERAHNPFFAGRERTTQPRRETRLLISPRSE